MVHKTTLRWETLTDAEQSALTSAMFEDQRRWLIGADFKDEGAALAAQGLAKQYGDRWELTATGHTVRAIEASRARTLSLRLTQQSQKI